MPPHVEEGSLFARGGGLAVLSLWKMAGGFHLGYNGDPVHSRTTAMGMTHVGIIKDKGYFPEPCDLFGSFGRNVLDSATSKYSTHPCPKSPHKPVAVPDREPLRKGVGIQAVPSIICTRTSSPRLVGTIGECSLPANCWRSGTCQLMFKSEKLQRLGCPSPPKQHICAVVRAAPTLAACSDGLALDSSNSYSY